MKSAAAIRERGGKMAEIIVDGQKIHYRCEGRGKPLLLLHGWGASAASFDALVPALAGHFPKLTQVITRFLQARFQVQRNL